MINRHGNLLIPCAFILLLAVAGSSLWISASNYRQLKDDNCILESELAASMRNYQDLEERVDVLSEEDDLLRSLAGVAGVDKEIRLLGTGGTYLPGMDEALTVSGKAVHQIESLEKIQEQLDLAISLQENSFKELALLLEDQRSTIDSYPSLRPVEGGWLVGEYGYRTDPFTGKRTFHRGIDISNRTNTPVLATADGRVIFSGWAGRYGRVVKINHGNGFVSLYAHNNRTVAKRGEKVKKGDLIAYLGSTGRATGPHLHFEIHKNGKSVNPVKYLLPDSGVFRKRL